MMIEPGWKVYRGMIVGEHTRDNDLEIQRAQGQAAHQHPPTSKDEAVRLTRRSGCRWKRRSPISATTNSSR